MSTKTIFVTGASGFLASHIIYQLANEGHRVRASARKNKVESLRTLYKTTPNVEIVQVDDIAHDDFGDALKDVDTIIHTASPLPGRAAPDVMLKSAIDGSLNVLRQGEKAGVKKFVVTSSTATVIGDPDTKGVAYHADHWNPVKREDADRFPYPVAKKYAELAVWEWAEARPHVDVTVINPPFLYGPLAPLHLPVPPGNYLALSTSLMIYNLISPNGQYPVKPSYVDFRDLAKAHIRSALYIPEKHVSGRKRLLFGSPHGLVFKDVVETIKKARPQLAERIAKGPIPEFDYDKYDLDFERVEEVTGLKEADFHIAEETILDTIDSMIEVEKEWQAQGYVLPEDVPPMILS
ncbi:NAD(P)-binding protein [Agrocybe pediades]|nr:NAD(P)-binding protein [Agrocybe pediades]